MDAKRPMNVQRPSDSRQLPNDMAALRRMVARLQSQVEEQAHSVLELKNHNDKLEEKNIDLQLKVDKLLQQLFGRRSERRVDGDGQLFLDLGDEATPEVVSALEEAVREAEQVIEDAEEEKQKRRVKPPRKGDRKFPDHLPRVERIVDLPEDRRKGLKLIGYDEVETLEWIRPELRVRVNKYAKYVHPIEKNRAGDEPSIISPERPTGLVAGDRFDASIGVEVIAWKYFYHLPFYRQQDLFAGSGWTPSRSTLASSSHYAHWLSTYGRFSRQMLAWAVMTRAWC